MNYEEIIKDSLKLAWRHKSLWFFGMFIAGVSGSNFDFGSELNLETFDPYAFDFDMAELMPFILGMFALAVFFGVLYLIAKTALIDAVNKLTRGGVYRFSDSFSTGLTYFWRMLGMSFFAYGLLFLLMIILVVITIAMMAVNEWLILIALLIDLPVLLFGFFGVISTVELGSRAMVVRDASIGDAAHEGWNLFWAHKTESFMIFLTFVVSSIAIGIATLMFFGMVSLPFIFSGVSLMMLTPLNIAYSIVVGGMFGTFVSALYTIFYFRLLEPPRPVARTPIPAAGQ